mgnify:CR=1 FL=1
MTSLIRFRACSADPKDQSGIATYTRGNLTVNVPIASFVHAQQLAAFIDAAVADAACRAKATQAAAIRGHLNNLEDTA